MTYFSLNDHKLPLEALASSIHEFRLLPIPYGLLAHELIEVIDNERIMPGITWISKMAEDFPFIDCHSMNKEQNKNFINSHQFVYVQCDSRSSI
jgi:hypothetical protein